MPWTRNNYSWPFSHYSHYWLVTCTRGVNLCRFLWRSSRGALLDMEKCCCFTLPKTKGQSLAPKRMEVVSLCHHFSGFLSAVRLLQVSSPLKYAFTGCCYCRIWSMMTGSSIEVYASQRLSWLWNIAKQWPFDSKYNLKTLLQQYWSLWSIVIETYLCTGYASSNDMYGMYNEENK